jgi:hypothetical protein
VALEFNPPNNYMGPFTFGVAVVAQKSGLAVANGQSTVTMMTGHHQDVTVAMTPGGAPTPGGGPDMALGPATSGGDMAGHD